MLDEVGVLQTGPDADMTWLHRDHLGSIVAKTTADTQTHLLANTPWGARQITHWDTSPTETADTPAFQHATRRGFTNHEHIDGTGLTLLRHPNQSVCLTCSIDSGLQKHTIPKPI